MSKPFRRILLLLALLVALLAILSGVGVTLFRGTPDFYAARPMHPAAERETMARSAENKIISVHNWAELVRADAARAATAKQRGATSAPATRAEGSHLIEFTQEELDALLDKWSALYHWQESYDQ